MKFTFHFNRFPFFAVLLVGLTILLQGCFKDKNASEEVCDNTCQYAYDGQCDDGGPNSLYSLCDCGTDCADCGTREVSDNDCLDGSSSSSSGSSGSSSSSSSSSGSSSSGGGGYTMNDIDGSWEGTSPGFTIQNLDLCSDGSFRFEDLIPIGTYVDQGTWTLQGSTLTLNGSNTVVYTIQSVSGSALQLYVVGGGYTTTFTLQSDNPCTITGGSSSSSSGSSSSGGSSSSSSSGGAVSCGSTVTDIDGNTYQVVQIGDQCWMRSNLRVKRFRDGSVISEQPFSTNGGESWLLTNTAGWTYPGGSSSNQQQLGLLYSFEAATDVRGLCPSGWRVPTRQDVEQLIGHFGSAQAAAYALKATSGWCSYNPFDEVTMCGNGNNSSGFTAYPAGFIDLQIGRPAQDIGYWFALNATLPDYVQQALSLQSITWEPASTNPPAQIAELDANTAISCRCVKD